MSAPENFSLKRASRARSPIRGGLSADADNQQFVMPDAELDAVLEAQHAAEESKAQRKAMRRLRREQEQRQVCVVSNWSVRVSKTCPSLRRPSAFWLQRGLLWTRTTFLAVSAKRKRRRRNMTTHSQLNDERFNLTRTLYTTSLKLASTQRCSGWKPGVERVSQTLWFMHF